MIKFLNSRSPYIQVQTYVPQPYINSGTPSAGMLRYRDNTVEVYNGSSWDIVTGGADVGLSPDAEAAIEWCKKKMSEEMRIQGLMEKHPGLRDAYEKFELMKILVTEEEKLNG